MYTTDIQAEGTVSATDEERLPPGGFSLRDLGVAGWFGRASRRSAGPQDGSLQTPLRRDVESPSSGRGSSTGQRSGVGSGNSGEAPSGGHISTYEILHYIRSTFDDESVLDAIPLSAAGNPGAWHAWRSHRIKSGAVISTSPSLSTKDRSTWHDGLSDSGDSSSGGAPEGYSRLAGGTSAPSAAARRPGEWNWEGVWEVRVKKGIENSISEAALFGKDVGDDLIRFLPLQQKDIEGIKEDMEKSMGVVDVQRGGVV
jgi:hypothetical protein